VPNYDHLVLLYIYMALPIAFFRGCSAYILGFSVSLVYVCFVLYMQYLNDQISFALLSSYAVYLFILNLIFSYFTVIRDYGIRRSVLSRYQLVYQNIVYQVSFIGIFGLTKKIFLLRNKKLFPRL